MAAVAVRTRKKELIAREVVVLDLLLLLDKPRSQLKGAVVVLQPRR